MAGRVGVVRVDEGARARPVDLVAEQRLDAGEQGEVVAGRAVFDAADQARLLAGGHRDRARRRVPGRVAERPRPQQVIPVRVGGPARHRAQAAVRQPAPPARPGRRRSPRGRRAGSRRRRRRRSSWSWCTSPRWRRRRQGRSRRPLARPWLPRSAPASRCPPLALAAGRWRLEARSRHTTPLLPDARRDQVQAGEERPQVVGGEPARPHGLGQPAGLPRARGHDQVAARRERADEHADDGPGRARVEHVQHEREDQAGRPREVDEPGEVAAGEDRLRLGQVPLDVADARGDQGAPVLGRPRGRGPRRRRGRPGGRRGRSRGWTAGSASRTPRSRYWPTPALAMRVTASAAYAREEEHSCPIPG